jgi:hypothetical protein
LHAGHGLFVSWRRAHSRHIRGIGPWGRVATRIVHRLAVPLTIGVLVFGALAAAVTAY